MELLEKWQDYFINVFFPVLWHIQFHLPGITFSQTVASLLTFPVNTVCGDLYWPWISSARSPPVRQIFIKSTLSQEYLGRPGHVSKVSFQILICNELNKVVSPKQFIRREKYYYLFIKIYWSMSLSIRSTIMKLFFCVYTRISLTHTDDLTNIMS